MDEWIHVDDRLPNLGSACTYIVFIQCPGHKSLAHVTEGWLWDDKWIDEDYIDLEFSEEDGNETIKHVVTHWRLYVTPPSPTTGILE